MKTQTIEILRELHSAVAYGCYGAYKAGVSNKIIFSTEALKIRRNIEDILKRNNIPLC